MLRNIPQWCIFVSLLCSQVVAYSLLPFSPDCHKQWCPQCQSYCDTNTMLPDYC